MQRELSAVFHGNALDLEFVDCYGQHLAWLETWFQRRLSCNGVASELAQEVFLKLYEQREQIPGLRQPKAWLTTVAHGLLVNHYRRADLERAYLAALFTQLPTFPTLSKKQFYLKLCLNLTEV